MKINTQRGIAPVAILVILVAVIGGGTYAAKKNSDKKAEKAAVQMEVNSTSTASTVATSTPAIATTSDKTLQVTLSEQNKSGQNGKVVITEVGGKAKVIVNITGKPSAVAQPSHIHVGSCAAIGAVKYPLTNIGNGASQTMLDVSIDQLLSQLPLAINVHKSATEVSVYTACGDVSTSTKK